MKLYVVPTNQVQRFWYLAEPILNRALEKGDGEFCSDTLKLTVAQGQQQLLLLMKDDVCYCALTVQWVMYCLLYTSPSPRDRQKSRMPSSA